MRIPAGLLLVLALTAGLAACTPSAPESGAESGPDADTRSVAKPTVAPEAVIAVDPSDLDAVRAVVAQRLPDVTIDALRPTPVPGLYEIQSGMNFGYVSADGRYLIQGDLADLASGARLTEDRRREARVQRMAAIPADQSIDFAPAGTPRYTVTVFTDIDCGYCRKLHDEIAQYNADGIAVRYLFFPRSGPDTASFHKAEQVWCSADRRAALTQAKQGATSSADKSCKNPVLDQFNLAAELQLRGTPAIILPDGEMIPGYQPAGALLQILAEHGGVAATPPG